MLPLAFAPLSWWPVAIISCATLYLLLIGLRFRRALLTGLSYGIGLYATGASWVYVSINQYGQASVLLATFLTAIFVIALGFVFALPLSLYAGIARQTRPCFRPLMFAAIWVLGEWLRGWFLTGFPWLYLGYGFIDTWLAGWGPLGGVLAISGIVAFSGAVVGNSLTRVISRDHLLIGSNYCFTTILAALLVMTFWLCGNILSKQSWTQPATKTALKVALVQPNHPVLEKWNGSTLPLLLADIRRQTQNLSNYDIVVWPESAIPAMRYTVTEFLDELDKMAKEHRISVITGIPTASENGEYFNSVIGLGLANGIYRKRHLVPFGEYVPLQNLLRGVISFFDLPMSSFSSGDKQQTLIKVGPYNLATAICYEIAYSGTVAADSNKANILLTVSNDTWFGNSLGPHQHLQIARMRALETAKPLIRATNDGITALISSQGLVTDQLFRAAAGVLRGSVLPRNGSTPYSRWGMLPVILLSFAILLLPFALSGLRFFRPDHLVKK